MTPDIHHQAILTSLVPLFKKAELEQLWFFHHSRDEEEIWCSPPYLRLEQSEGRLIMSPEHWELRSPVGYLNKLIIDARVIVDEYNQLAKKLGYEETLALESHSTNPADAH
jgi:hypothetical protein